MKQLLLLFVVLFASALSHAQNWQENEPNDVFATDSNTYIYNVAANDSSLIQGLFLSGELFDEDIYLFRVTQNTRYTFRAHPASVIYPPATGLQMRLYYQGDTNIVVASVNDGLMNVFPSFSYTSLHDTLMYLKVSALNDGVGEYNVTVQSLRADLFEQNDDFATANVFNNSSKVSNVSFYPKGDNDFYKINALLHEQLQIVWTNEQKGYLQLYDSSKNVVSQKWLNHGDVFNHRFVSQQTYYMKLSAADSTTHTYSFDFTLQVPQNITPVGTFLNVGETEDFYSSNLSAGWQIINADNDLTTWQWSPTTGYRLAGLSLTMGDNGNDDWLITPLINVPENGELHFWTHGNDGQSAGLEAWIGFDNTNSTSQLTHIQTWNINHGDFRETILFLNDYAGSNIRVAFRGTKLAAQLHLDEFTLMKGNKRFNINGIIHDATNEMPIVGAKVSLGTQTANTDANGAFLLANVEKGLMQLLVSKTGYNNRVSNFILSSDTSLQILLAPLEAVQLYKTNFETGQDVGGVDTVITNGWRVSSQVSTPAGTIKPYRGQKMLLWGGSNSYPNNLIASWTHLTTGTTDLSSCKTATLKFAVNYDLGNGDKVLPVIKRNGVVNYININGDAYSDFNDFYSGASGGWKYKTYDISSYCGTTENDAIEFGFLAVSNNQTSTNFGFAADTIVIQAVQQKTVPVPDSLQAQSYIDNAVILSWKPVADSNITYKIYRREANTDYLFLGENAYHSFTDVKVENGKRYFYKVTATADYSESNFSNEVFADVGVPTSWFLTPTDFRVMTFNDSLENALWSSYPDVYDWHVSSDINQSGMILKLPEHSGNVLVVNKLSGVNVNNDITQHQTIAISPMFELSDPSNVVLAFKNFGQKSNSEQHLIAIRQFINGVVSDWQIIDTVSSTDSWSYQGIIIPILESTRFQVGFLFSVVSTNEPMGWAIDDILLMPLKPGSVGGYVKSSAGQPIVGARLQVIENGAVTYTDANGYYKFDAQTMTNPLLGPVTYETKITALGYNDHVEHLSVGYDSNSEQDITLDFAETAPWDLQLSYDQNSNAVLQWQVPQPSYLIKWDDDKADGSRLQTSNKLKSEIVLPYNGLFRWSRVQLLMEAGQFPARASALKIYSVRGADTTMYLNKTNVTLDSLGTQGTWVWAGFKTDCVTDTNVVMVEITTNKKLRLAYSLHEDNHQYEWISNQWKYIEHANIMRVQLNVGSDFAGTYNITKVKGTDTSWVRNIKDNTYTDTQISFGSNAVYTVNANYNTGVSPESNKVTYQIKDFAWLQQVGNMVTDTNIAYNVTSFSTTTAFTNIGFSPLKYKIQYNAGYTPNVKANIKKDLQEYAEWARVRCFQPFPAVGDTAILALYLENENQGTPFSISDVEVRFPQSIKVLSATSFVTLGETDTDYSLFSSNAQGYGATVHWFDNDGGVGHILPDHVALSWVKIAVTNNYKGEGLQVVVKGDQHHVLKNTVQGMVHFDAPPFNVSFTPALDSIAASDTLMLKTKVTVTTSKEDYYPGYWTIKSNDANHPAILMPFNIGIEHEHGTIEGHLGNISNHEAVVNQVVWLTDTINPIHRFADTTDATGKFYFGGLINSTYRLTVNRNGFAPYEIIKTIAHEGEDIITEAFIKADVRPPFITDIADDTTNITLKWLPRSFDALEGFEGTNGSEVAGFWSSSVSSNAKWYYRKNTLAAQGTSFAYSVGDSGAILMMSEPATFRMHQGHLVFRAINLGTSLNNINESFNVRMYTNQSANDTIVYTYQFGLFDGWKKFDIPIHTDADSVWLAIERTSSGDGGLAIDAVSLVNLLALPQGAKESFTPIAKLQNYALYRSTDNQHFDQVALLPKTTTTYSDVVTAGKTFYYQLKGLYDIAATDESETMHMQITNYAPVLSPIADQTMNENGQLAIPLKYNDPNGKQGINFAAKTIIDRFVTLIANDTLFIYPFKDWSGMSRVDVSVTDGMASDTVSFILTVTNINNAPVFTSPSGTVAEVGKQFSLTLTATDADRQDVLTFSASNLPAWLTFNAATATLSGTPQQADGAKTFIINAKVSDGTLEASQQISITVAKPNLPPAFTSQPVTSAEVFQPYIYNIVASDPETDSLAFEVVSKPLWLNLSPTSRATATLSGLPPVDAGNTTVIISISDGNNTPVQQQFNIKVSPVGINNTSGNTNVKLYPNPANTLLVIETSNVQNHATVVLFDAQGKQVLKQNITATTQAINIEHLPQGAYTVQINDTKTLQLLPLLIVR